ncbi:DarT ssDNA thymidine ADP-ribosyltransferase family protein [Neptunomonas sp.]|uniref:DarT ssDNA thymidine ADP-ribosyltransferase family protein n=1 Tax=Neptunomonas sp. TaxID=1971898 RepID=UPI003561711A
MSTIKEIVEGRGITEVLHFTTNQGLLGILDSQKIRSRKRLEGDQRLAHILKLNTQRVLDPPAWIDFVNLSISKINHTLYGISSGSFHGVEVNWRILSFSTDILEHEGVYFATANNGWPACLRESGPEGLESLFSDSVKGRYSDIHNRYQEMPSAWTTCEQAEVLYPREFSTGYLNKIYVKSEKDLFSVDSKLGATKHSRIEVCVDPSKFGIKDE